MADYQQMYLKLFNKVSDVIEELQQAQQETEELYIQGGGPELVALKPEKDESKAAQKGRQS